MTDLTVQQQREYEKFQDRVYASTGGLESLVDKLTIIQKMLDNPELTHIRDIPLFEKKKEFLDSCIETFKTTSEALVEEEPQQPSQEITEEYIARKFISILNNAERRGKEFNLTLKEVKKLLNRKTCYYTGVKLVNPLRDHEGNPIDNARTFDRIDNEQGYVLGNVVACSHWSNQLKNILFEAPEGLALGKEKLVKKLLEKML